MTAATPIGEFEIIERFFASLGARRGDVVLGVGDDGAILTPRAGCELVVVTDTLIEGRHFPAASPPASVGHRALAVNLSDIAAMGAEPAWALLALTLPRADPAWLAEFARGFGTLAQSAGVALVGGDTTSGPLSMTVTVLGQLPAGTALRRNGARAGDVLFVSGTPGDAARGLQHDIMAQAGTASIAGDAATRVDALRQRFRYPMPRLQLGMGLRGIASACIDVSDGLAADAGKIAAASGCGVSIDVQSLPLSTALLQDAGEAQARDLALCGGDDYELCFAVPAAQLALLAQRLPVAAHPYQRIGVMTAAPGMQLHVAGQRIELPVTGFDHFR
jgi:thiamine-monophosphate kinase